MRQCCDTGRCCAAGHACVGIDSSAADSVDGAYLFPYDNLVFSFVSTASALAFLGTTATLLWKILFLIFIASQLLLRAASVCGLLVVLLSDSGALAPMVANASGYDTFVRGSGRISAQLGAGTLLDIGNTVGLDADSLVPSTLGERASVSSGGYGLVAGYIVLSAATSLLFNSRYALGLSQRTAPIMSVLNVFVAIDVSEYSLLSSAVPRPPRLSFFLFRMVDMSLCLVLFMRHLDQSVLPDSLKFVVVGLILLCPALYCVCLLVPHSDIEPVSKGVSRALKNGAVRSGFQRAQGYPGHQDWGQAAKNGWTAVGSVFSLIVRCHLSHRHPAGATLSSVKTLTRYDAGRCFGLCSTVRLFGKNARWIDFAGTKLLWASGSDVLHTWPTGKRKLLQECIDLSVCFLATL